MRKQSRCELLNEFQTLTAQEKLEKIQIYLYAMQKSDKNYIGLYGIVEELGSENIDETLLTELYTTLLDITLIWKEIEESWLDKVTSKLQNLKENIINEKESDNIIKSIDNL